MFDQLRDLNNLRKQAAELQKQLAAEKITANSGNGQVTISINGNHELLEVIINSDLSGLDKSQLANSFKDAYNKAADQLKSILASKFRGMI
ncbi:MAG: YbaB/EbfC family nucleoid-associated protein [Candidatus Doudnabacteria bacterium]|nr:YbaB/EbfC family nucleoid-associated protein [Candidatus Doudnabacteria bacterium]